MNTILLKYAIIIKEVRTMKIIYVHHALRQVGNPPSQDDKIQPLGIQDAETTAELLKIMSDKSKSTFKAIYTSPYYRCAKTAEISWSVGSLNKFKIC